MGFNTELLHGTKTGDPVTGATLTPVYQSSAFFQPSAEQHEKLFHNKAAGYSYTRINNPTIAAFEERMTVLEKGVASVACASGMAAITNALLNIVGSGDEIITSTSLYGGTIDLYHDLEAFGITTIFADTNDLEDLESKITDKTRVIFAETIGNPKLDVTDIPALARIAKRHNLPLMIDNTVATAFLVRPLELGGERLMELQLAAKLGVSRTPIREAIRMLEQEGLAVTMPRKGAEVAKMTLKDMEDVLEIREALDELAVKIACDKISEKELQKLLEVKDQFENSTKTGDVKMIAEMDVKFHDVIFESTGNPKLVTLLNNLREQIYRYRVEYIKNPDNYPVLIAEHNAIAEGLKNRDKEAATLAMHKHVKNQAVAVKSVIQCQDETENE